MEPISQKELEEIFDGTEFKLRVDTYPWIKNFRYCYIDRGDESLCC